MNDVHKRKFNSATGKFEKHKTRVCVFGNYFLKGVDCAADIFSPTASVEAIRLFLAIAVQFREPIWSMDVVGAYLSATNTGNYYALRPIIFLIAQMSEEEVQALHEKLTSTDTSAAEIKRLRQWCNSKGDRDDKFVYSIQRAVYGDPSSSKAFFNLWSSVMGKLGVRSSKIEPCIWFKHMQVCKYCKGIKSERHDCCEQYKAKGEHDCCLEWTLLIVVQFVDDALIAGCKSVK